MTDEPTRLALVTGGNRGLGFEIARQLGAQGIRVLIGSRRPAGWQPLSFLNLKGSRRTSSP